MLCLECGAEMNLVRVVEDTTMFVSGYEHHTWQCSVCSTVEQRMTFTREQTSTPTVPVQPTQTVPEELTQTAALQPAQAVPAEPTPTVQPTQTVPLAPTQIVSVERVKRVAVEPAHPKPPAASLQTNARLEKLRSLQERATIAKEAASETERRAEFDRFWESLQAAPPVAPASTVQDERVARSVVTEHSREIDTEPMPVQVAPSVAPASTVQGEHVARSGVLGRVVAKIRGQ